MNTLARIASICMDGCFKHSVADNRQSALKLLESALIYNPDLVCLPEAFTDTDSGLPLNETAEALDGPTLELFGKAARRAGCYIVCPIHTLQNGLVYNSSVLVGRDGSVAGVYNKVCPVTTSFDYTSLEGGITPGSVAEVFDLDFGRIGLQICFDAGFPENWQALADKGARLVVWSSAYDGGFPLRVYAYLHHYYVVTSTRTHHSRVVDPVGEILAESKPGSPVIVRDINLDYVVSHWDWNMAIPERIKEKYGDAVSVRQWDLGSAHFIVEPMRRDIRSAGLQDEFGFDSSLEYHNIHRAAYKRMADGEKPLPAKARHGDRPQYGK